MRAEDLASKPGNERNDNENLPLCPELTCLLRRRRDIDALERAISTSYTKSDSQCLHKLTRHWELFHWDSDTKQVMSPEHATADL